ncbi:MAG: ABC transporter ATP-binding protein [Desulfuromonadia bacterium]
MTDSTNIIEAEGLRKSFNGHPAVDGITFSVRTGECFGILGPNGAGKTTTIRMLYGFTPRDAGLLRLFGLESDCHWRSIKNRIGVCQQENTLDPDLSVRENLEIFASYFDPPPYGEPLVKRVARLLDFIALTGREDAEVRELSGGMARRLVLARALINDPDILFLDEPTTGLDPQSRHLLWNRLDDLKKRGITTILTTHAMDEAERLCDRLLIIDHGRILVEGSPRRLIAEKIGSTVIEVIAPCDDLRRMLRERTIPHEDLERRLVIYTNDGDGLYRELLDRHCREGCMLRPATLEDLFLKLTGRGLRE